MQKIGIINLDANSTFGTLPEVSAGVRELLAEEQYGLNPSSVHSGGQVARRWIERARNDVRELIDADQSCQVIFTSGATEANNMAMALGVTHIVTSAVEHPSVSEPANRLARAGTQYSTITFRDSQLQLNQLESVLTEKTALVSIMLANNETGSILPVNEAVSIVRRRAPNALFHTDAVQAVGKIPASFSKLGVDLLSLSGHKIGALSGIGALVVRSGIQHKLPAFILGGPQESKFRAGTENLLGIITLGMAARHATANLERRASAMREARDTIRQILGERVKGISFNGENGERLPNTLSVTFSGIRADDLVVALDLEEVLVSSGAACSSGKPQPSHVLTEIGLTQEQARSTIRISVTGTENLDRIGAAAETIAHCVARMRGLENGRVH